jgi:hypothetical protein
MFGAVEYLLENSNSSILGYLYIFNKRMQLPGINNRLISLAIALLMK